LADLRSNRKTELKRQRGVEERDKTKSVWRMQCEQLAQYDSEIAEKEIEIAELKARLARSDAMEGRMLRGMQVA